LIGGNIGVDCVFNSTLGYSVGDGNDFPDEMIT
jgi:hypothetical protein